METTSIQNSEMHSQLFEDDLTKGDKTPVWIRDMYMWLQASMTKIPGWRTYLFDANNKSGVFKNYKLKLAT